jgi:hypothetical protein
LTLIKAALHLSQRILTGCSHSTLLGERLLESLTLRGERRHGCLRTGDAFGPRRPQTLAIDQQALEFSGIKVA